MIWPLAPIAVLVAIVCSILLMKKGRLTAAALYLIGVSGSELFFAVSDYIRQYNFYKSAPVGSFIRPDALQGEVIRIIPPAIAFGLSILLIMPRLINEKLPSFFSSVVFLSIVIITAFCAIWAFAMPIILFLSPVDGPNN